MSNSKLKSFYIYSEDDKFRYSADQIFEINNKIFLVESNKQITKEDIIFLNNNRYDILNNSFYIMAIINKEAKEIVVSYGLFSYCHSLYYYKDGKNIYINLSLHDLLEDIKIIPELNLDSANEFVKYGFVRDIKSLIKNINKIPALKTFIFKDNKIDIIDSEYIKNKSLGNYVDNLKVTLPDQKIKIILPLSGGYDSTLLAYLLKDYKDKVAITAGSLDDRKNEFTNADNTTKCLSMRHEKVFADND